MLAVTAAKYATVIKPSKLSAVGGQMSGFTLDFISHITVSSRIRVIIHSMKCSELDFGACHLCSRRVFVFLVKVSVWLLTLQAVFLSVLQAKEKVRNHLNTIDYSCSFTEGV